MIARSHRFHGYGSLRYVYQHGQTVRGGLCALKYCPNDRRKTYRLSVVVSKKVSKSAVVRNRIRRRLYEVFRHREASFVRPYDMVMTVFHEQVATIPAEDLEKIVDDQLTRAGVVKNNSKNDR